MKKIAFIGAGNMASAIVGGIVSSQLCPPNNIILYDKKVEQYSKFPSQCLKAEDIKEAVVFSDFVFLSVKPQNLKDVLCEIKDCDNLSNKAFVSICAGVLIDTIVSEIGNVKVARAMPNTPLLIGQGTTGICKNKILTDEEFSFIKEIFSSSGFVATVCEEDINNVTALTGSAPAYIYLFVKAATESAKKLGFTNNDAIKMFCNTLIGSANMILNSDQSLDELIRMVTSPNGTTERALKSFEADNFSRTIFNAMKACADRADELSRLV